jgi:mRNA-degrading endonuclease RelE of RelBE toxin-antitoxin system
MTHAIYLALSSSRSRCGSAPDRQKIRRQDPQGHRRTVADRTSELLWGAFAKVVKGYWKLRVGDFRVVFKVIESEVWILGIRHRKSIYMDIGKRV